MKLASLNLTYNARTLSEVPRREKPKGAPPHNLRVADDSPMSRVAAESLRMRPQLAGTETDADPLACSCVRLLPSTILKAALQGASRPREGTIPPEQFGSTNINLTSARQRTRGD